MLPTVSRTRRIALFLAMQFVRWKNDAKSCATLLKSVAREATSEKVIFARTIRAAAVPEEEEHAHRACFRRLRPRTLPALRAPAGAGRTRSAFGGEARCVGRRAADDARSAPRPGRVPRLDVGRMGGMAAANSRPQPGERAARFPTRQARHQSREGSGSAAREVV